MDQYNVEVNGIKHTVQLDAEAAKLAGLTDKDKVSGKKSAAEAKAAQAQADADAAAAAQAAADAKAADPANKSAAPATK